VTETVQERDRRTKSNGVNWLCDDAYGQATLSRPFQSLPADANRCIFLVPCVFICIRVRMAACQSLHVETKRLPRGVTRLPVPFIGLARPVAESWNLEFLASSTGVLPILNSETW
jgi:hypothetical protein